MEKAYIILAHKNPDQLYRLIEKLDDQSSSFFIHIDKKVPLASFKNLTGLGNKIALVDRVNTSWAGWSLVQATINGLRAVEEANRHFDRIILMSGQDYPIKSNYFINKYFTNTPYRIFMEHYPLPNYTKWKKSGGMYRINKYFFGMNGYQRLASKAVNFLANIFPFMRRKVPPDTTIYAGSQWWTIDMNALQYILEFIRKNPAHLSFYKFSFAPDEIFFQTILLNSANEKITGSILNNHKRFMNWNNPSISHPEILLKNDFTAVIKSDALFARKFDVSEDSEILEMIDKQRQAAAHCH